jgi:hypothetical protein
MFRAGLVRSTGNTIYPSKIVAQGGHPPLLQGGHSSIYCGGMTLILVRRLYFDSVGEVPFYEPSINTLSRLFCRCTVPNIGALLCCR